MNLKEIIHFEDRDGIFDFEEHKFEDIGNGFARYDTQGDIFPYSLEVLITWLKGGDLLEDSESYKVSKVARTKIEIVSILEQLYDDIQLKNAILEIQNTIDEPQDKTVRLDESEYDFTDELIPISYINSIDSREFSRDIEYESRILTEYINEVVVRYLNE